jgi:hypothetical protein
MSEATHQYQRKSANEKTQGGNNSVTMSGPRFIVTPFRKMLDQFF